MRIAIFTPAEKRLALLLFVLTLIGLLARGGRSLSPEVAAWLDEVADSASTRAPVSADTVRETGVETLGHAQPGAGTQPRETARPAGTPARVDPNQATLDELTTLPGVGPVLARRILEDRDKNGKYQTPEDLLRVSGIGKTTLERIRPHVALSPSS